jgi:Txe/YoeB family toxin of Txe-Axe toxin-antitoxin module
VHVQPEAMEDLRHWVQHDRKLAIKVLDLIELRGEIRSAGSASPNR